jgi:hypothetical protein
MVWPLRTKADVDAFLENRRQEMFQQAYEREARQKVAEQAEAEQLASIRRCNLSPRALIDWSQNEASPFSAVTTRGADMALLWPFRRSNPKVVVSVTGPGTFDVDVVGESHYQRELEDLCGGRTRESADLETEAYLVPEDDNPRDRNAVRVCIDGFAVGNLDRDMARAWRMRVTQFGRGVCTAKCQAKIVGGWDRGARGQGHFGVKLDLPGYERGSERRDARPDRAADRGVDRG